MNKERLIIVVIVFCFVIAYMGCNQSKQDEASVTSAPAEKYYGKIEYDKKLCEMIELNEHKQVVPEHFELQPTPEEIMSITLRIEPKSMECSLFP